MVMCIKSSNGTYLWMQDTNWAALLLSAKLMLFSMICASNFNLVVKSSAVTFEFLHSFLERELIILCVNDRLLCVTNSYDTVW